MGYYLQKSLFSEYIGDFSVAHTQRICQLCNKCCDHGDDHMQCRRRDHCIKVARYKILSDAVIYKGLIHAAMSSHDDPEYTCNTTERIKLGICYQRRVMRDIYSIYQCEDKGDEGYDYMRYVAAYTEEKSLSRLFFHSSRVDPYPILAAYLPDYKVDEHIVEQHREHRRQDSESIRLGIHRPKGGYGEHSEYGYTDVVNIQPHYLAEIFFYKSHFVFSLNHDRCGATALLYRNALYGFAA